LPTAVFVNHQRDHISAGDLAMTELLEEQCRNLQKKAYVRAVFHVNAATGHGVAEAFESFMRLVTEDQGNRVTDELSDDLWDESLKVPASGRITRQLNLASG